MKTYRPSPLLKRCSNVRAMLGILLLCTSGLSSIAQLKSVPVADASFQPHPGAKPPIAFQVDGKVLVSGDNFLIQGTVQRGLARLNADGTLDTTFAAGSGADPSTISSIVVQPDQKILVGGTFTNFSGQPASGLVRLLSDGKRDSSFTYDGSANVTKVALSASGDLLILASPFDQIRRHSANGTTKTLLPRPLQQLPGGDPSGGGAPEFAAGSIVAINVAELSNGTVLGAFHVYDNAGYPGQGSESWYVELFAYDADGASIASWPVIQPARVGHEGGSVGNTTQIIALASGGFYVLGPQFAWSLQPPVLALYKSDGSLDPSFVAPKMIPRDPSGIYPGGGLVGSLDSAGLLVLSGQIFVDPAYPNDTWSTVRLSATGSIDPTFGIPAAVYPSPAVNPEFLGVKSGSTPGDDRVFAYSYNANAIVEYKLKNTLILGPENTLAGSQTVTAGKGVGVSAPQAVPNSQWQIQWQISTNGGSTWSNLTDDGTYQGATTPTLKIANATAAINGASFRYVSTSPRGTVSSNATTLSVEPLFFPFPASIAVDAANNLYVGDISIHTIQRISPTGQVSGFVGSNGHAGASDGTGTNASFSQPGGLTATAAGALTVSDTANGTIRSVTAAGLVSTLAGSSANRGSTDGIGNAARFSAPVGITQDSGGTFYVADSTNHIIRKITPDGTVTTFAGTAGLSGASDGTGGTARFNNPTGVTVDASGNVYVADTTNNLIRKISPGGVVTTLAGVPAVSGAQDGTGSGALFNQPGGLAADAAGNIYLADTGNSAVRKITPSGIVTTLAGLPTIGGMKDGTGSNAWFNQPKALTIGGSGNLYVADTGNAAIRQVSPAGVVTTLALSAVGPTLTTQPASLTVTTGSSASFSVSATSPSSLTYQWKKDGTDIPGATSATYTISSASSSNTGSYTVIVSNLVGAVTSSAATLTVNAPSALSTGPSGGGGGGGAFGPWFAGLLGLLAFLRRNIRSKE